MTKSQLIRLLAKQSGAPVQDSSKVVRIFFDSIKGALQKGDKVEIRGFGSFILKKYGGYTGRNPRTGESVRVGKKKLPIFKPGKELRERINDSKETVEIKKQVRKNAK
ncbi:MAG: integration host factor subunit beta [Deltaproteobacteria bacterium]|jgi:integration host factor subunit beta|nr:integration host factor subunit beta [Deltaproteobacteria bacterium]MDP7157351.1 HU family DNA-binding protein [SAR324 cluster bacterium]MDP7317099.1 HU family DNA-binding protein [SAR324 cluster bacterium]|tara:strand:+ start:329 stop:652 length:324 start_codon:yes stop_codon:yes gene_type:complete